MCDESGIPRRLRIIMILIGLLASSGLWVGVARAWYDPGPREYGESPNGMIVIDGSYVMDVGELQMNITNHGLIGSQYTIVSDFSDSPSGQWPSGSGNEYLFSAGIWIGGIKNGEAHVSTGQYDRELRPLPGVESTIYEAKYGTIVRPQPHVVRGGSRVFEPNGDDDHDGLLNEELLNGFDEDGDGLIDEDFEMQGSQMMVCTLYDNTPLVSESYPDHLALDLKIVQTAFAWEMDEVDDFVVIRYDITNIGAVPVEQVYLGMFVDCDIGVRDTGANAFDDLVGRYTGMARATNGIYEHVDVAYMFDANQKNPVPGYFGVMFRSSRGSGHSIRTFQRYTGHQAYALGGDPLNDAERYNELSKSESDSPLVPDLPGDYRFLVTNGPWFNLSPGRPIHFEVVFVCGDGLEGMLENCANAHQAWEGAWYDLDNNDDTGKQGKESLLCLQDYGYTLETFALSPFAQMTAAYSDMSCLSPDHADFIVPDDLIQMSDGRDCIWVNTDNCDECENIRGSPCTASSFFRYWYCNRWWLSADQKRHCTGVGGKESVVRWITESMPPPPDMRVWAEDRRVHVYWNNDSEYERDLISNHMDFEGYQIWRADDWTRPAGTSEATGPDSRLWSLVGEFDLINSYIGDRNYGFVAIDDTIPLGSNVGLEAALYRPSCLDNPLFTGLEEMMQVALASGIHVIPELRPPVRDAFGNILPGMETLAPWEAYPAELDTFYWSAEFDNSGDPDLPAKAAMRFYEFIDDHVDNGYIYFYAVTTTDHDVVFDISGNQILQGPGVAGDPSTNFISARPSTLSRSAVQIAGQGSRVYVYPNPATRLALAEFQQMSPNRDDPTGVRIMFSNLPRTRCSIDIFSLNGDLVQTLKHDGTGGVGDVSWNLVSHNGQEVASGIYLYVVKSVDPDIEDFIDKFVVIR